MSSSGAAEFAKRFLVKGMQVDLSPISMLSLLGFHHPYGEMAIREMSHVEDYSLLMRIGGAGYRTRSAGKKSKSAFCVGFGSFGVFYRWICSLVVAFP